MISKGGQVINRGAFWETEVAIEARKVFRAYARACQQSQTLNTMHGSISKSRRSSASVKLIRTVDFSNE